MAKESTIEYLRKKASLLPKTPGVYLMEDSGGRVIYVGKSRALKNRVSSYFHGSHNIKTDKMVSHVADFRYITCDTEMEALVLENNLIKQYTPKYNILLKDAKSYPYIKVTTNEDYPRVVMTRKRSEKGTFFGPYSGVGTVNSVIATIEKTLGLPSCKKKFPEDIGRGRPCVYRQIGRCCGLCAGDISREEYGELIKCAIQLLKGNTRDVEEALIKRMSEAAEDERFEEAARCRDSIAALKKLGERQKTQLSPDTECDIIAFSSHEGCDCAAVLYIRGGMICDSEYFMFGADEITGDIENEESPISAFLVNLYVGREYIPPEILLSFEMGDEDKAIIEKYLTEKAGRKVSLRTPKKGEGRKLCIMAENDARVHSETRRKREDTDEKILVSLAHTLSLEVLPERIEAYDISNMGSEHITAGMIVIEKGRLKKSHYRYFRIKGKDSPDDYGSMRETILRRLSHIDDGCDESFSAVPDLILLDGGATHVAVVREIMRDSGYSIPVFGMVKDEHHKTRTLVTDTMELSIARDPELFRFIYKIQEEVHRFTVSRMTEAKRKTLKTSSLEKIKGIGPAKAKKLLAAFGTLGALKTASAEEIKNKGKVSENDALAVYEYFNKEQV